MSICTAASKIGGRLLSAQMAVKMSCDGKVQSVFVINKNGN